MTLSSDYLDLVYVSELKVHRLSRLLTGRAIESSIDIEATLPIPTLKLNAHVGKAGREDHQVHLKKLEGILRRSPGIRSVGDAYLSGGHWFEGETAMRYGQGKWDFSPEDEGPVLFVGSADGVDLMLAGSPQHLVDREILSSSGRTGSTSERLREELQRVLEVQEGGARTRRLRSATTEDLQDSLFDTFDCVAAEFAKRAPEARLRFLAQAHEVFDDWDTGRRVVLGTPLFVTRAQPVLVPGFMPRRVSVTPAKAAATTRGWFGRRRPKVRPTLPPPQSRELALRNASDQSGSSRDHPIIRNDAEDTSLPSLEVALYVRPASAASYASPRHYYSCNSHIRPGRASEAVGEQDFLTERVHWLDEQGGRWVVSFCRRQDDTSPLLTSLSLGDLVATHVSSSGPEEVLVLERASTFGEIASNLRGYRQADPTLRWVTTRLSGNDT